MGASAWNYCVPYEPDLHRAFESLRRKVFKERDYLWAGAYRGRRWPKNERALWRDESTQEEGTHSILDISRIIGPCAEPASHTLKPVTEEEALRLFGTRRPTRSDLPETGTLPCERWHGRAVVLFDAEGAPNEIYFWGVSGD
ncbi:hypothetical protein [Streptomyces yanii]|uniref:Uncharacterized protein n=1 Tax=Streptomyces yanii TaxID=78510 RepID=A0ABV5RME5_9ACTN